MKRFLAALLDNLWILAGAEAVAILVFRFPATVHFDQWAFQEWGNDLVAQSLITRGYRPGIDFGYPYGLLPLLWGRGWFRIWPTLTPAICVFRMALVNLAVAAGIVRFLKALKVEAAGRILFLVAMPFVVLDFGYPTFAHCFEAILLSHGLAEQASGRRGSALALAAAAWLAKPALAVFFGAMLLLFILNDLRLNDSLRWDPLWKQLRPATIVAGVLVIVLGLSFGWAPLRATLLPVTAINNYRAVNYGFFFGEGQRFWYHAGAMPGYYFGTIVTFWLIASVWLIGIGTILLADLIAVRDEAPSRAKELAITCAVLQVVFIGLLYGAAASWMYYVYVLIMGVAATSMLSKQTRRVVWALAVLALIGQKSFVADGFKHWQQYVPGNGTNGFRELQAERIEWERTLETVGRLKSVVFLPRAGAAELMFPVFAEPNTYYLARGCSLDSEIARKAEQMAQADAVVAVANSQLLEWPEFSSALTGFDRTGGQFFAVYIRRAEK